MLWSTIKSCAPKALKEAFLTFDEFDLWWRERTILGFNDRRMYSLQSRRILQRDRGKCYPFILDVETNGELGESKIDSSCYIMTTDENGTQSQIVYKQHRSQQNLAWCSLLIGQLIPLVICESYAVWDRVKAEPALSGAFPWSCTRYSHVMCAFKRTLNLAVNLDISAPKGIIWSSLVFSKI